MCRPDGRHVLNNQGTDDYVLTKEKLLPNRCQYLNIFVWKPHKYLVLLVLHLIQTRKVLFVLGYFSVIIYTALY